MSILEWDYKPKTIHKKMNVELMIYFCETMKWSKVIFHFNGIIFVVFKTIKHSILYNREGRNRKMVMFLINVSFRWKELGPRTAKLALFHVKIVKHEIV